MKYQNPVLKGFYPDPSVCFANGKFYMICSTMHYFPGVPLFESDDLIHWNQIGHCLTRPSQIDLNHVPSSGGVFAPTIRFYNGRFYMVTTNESLQKNFYIWTDNIYGEWSDPIIVEQGGIDPSLYFEGEHTYFMSNGADDQGNAGITQCEIDIKTGKKLSPSQVIWTGSGGRYLEGPHLYKIKDYYYLVAAEGGTEYGHMVTYARGTNVNGPFLSYPNNPVLTNRNLGGFFIQGIGHGDLVSTEDGNYWMVSLGFRQTGQYSTFHHLGREVFLTPVTFDENGWFAAGDNGTTRECFDAPHQKTLLIEKKVYSFANTDLTKDWIYLRIPSMENYSFQMDGQIYDSKDFAQLQQFRGKSIEKVFLRGTTTTLDLCESPTFLGIRQKDFIARITCDVTIDREEAGLCLMMDETHHYEIGIQKKDATYFAFLRVQIGTVVTIIKELPLGNAFAQLQIDSSLQSYTFKIVENETVHTLGTLDNRYLSSEVCGGFTGVIVGLYAQTREGNNLASFFNFSCTYFEESKG